MQKLLELLKRGCCIFIGAGIPRLIGFPTWEEMVREMLNYTWKMKEAFIIKPFTISEKKELEDMMKQEKFIHVLTFCKDTFKKNRKIDDYYKKLKDMFYDQSKYTNINNEGYAELLKLGKLGEKSFFVQTNVDLSLESYIKQFNKSSIFANISLPHVNNIPSLSLIYLHGIITNKNSLILTIDEYNTFYQRNNVFINFLNGLFNYYDVFFLGYGLGDKEILDTIARTNSQKLRILALGESERDKTRNKMFAEYLNNHYGIEVIEYDIEFGYERIIDFFKDLNVKLMKPPQVSAPFDNGSRL